MTTEQTDPRVLADQVDEMLQRLQDSAPPPVAEQVEDLVRALAALYGAGLGRAVEIAVDHGGQPLLRRLADDELVGSLLAVHDLHPDAVEVRVQAALDRVRPFLGTHAGDVELLGVDEEGVVRLQLRGSCDGCPSSALTVQGAIEGAILDAAPEVTAVDVAGVVSDEPVSVGGLLQIQPYQPRREAPGPCPVPAGG